MQTKLEQLANDIANIISDYEVNIDKCIPNDYSHVLKWVEQFPDDGTLCGKYIINLREFILEQTLCLLQKSYFSKSDYLEFIDDLLVDLDSETIDIIKASSFLNIQKNGCSQSHFLEELSKAFYDKYKITLNININSSDNYYYIDDFSFTGDRIYNDLEGWIRFHAPDECYITIITICSHTYGNYNLNKSLKKLANETGKSIKFEITSLLNYYKNDLSNRDKSDVFWLKHGNRYNRSGFIDGSIIFDNSENRDIFEEIIFEAGKHIISLCQNPSSVMKPLGYSRISSHMGFGGTIFSYKNCPNTTPLAFWWGDPNADSSSPLSQWYPLFIRRIYNE